jgi:transcriptional regulator with XRE-family HTH domain
MKYTSMLFANKIRELRGSKQMLQRHVSAALDVDHAMYCKIERGECRAKKEQILLINMIELNAKSAEIVKREDKLKKTINEIVKDLEESNYE